MNDELIDSSLIIEKLVNPSLVPLGPPPVTQIKRSREEIEEFKNRMLHNLMFPSAAYFPKNKNQIN